MTGCEYVMFMLRLMEYRVQHEFIEITLKEKTKFKENELLNENK